MAADVSSDGFLTRLMKARAAESETIVAIANLGERIAEAARWYLEEGTQEAREALAGAVAGWEMEA